MELSASAFLERINSLESSFYLVFGEHSYDVEKVLNEIKKKNQDSDQENFGVKNFSSKDHSLKEIIEIAKTPSIFAKKQFFFIQDLEINKSPFSKDFNKYSESFFQNSHYGTTLIFINKGNDIDKISKIYKLIKEYGLVIRCQAPTEKEISGLIKNYVSKKKITITQNAIYLIKIMTGGDIRLIYTELDKIFLNIKIKNIDEIVVKKYLSDNRSYNFFQIQEAIIERNYSLSFEILDSILQKEGNPGLILTLSILYNFFCKILIVHQFQKKSLNEIANAISVPLYFIDKYQTAAKNFSKEKIKIILHKIFEVDLATKGAISTNLSYEDLAKDLLMTISF